MIEQPCGGCGRVWCNCPEPEEDNPWGEFTEDWLSLILDHEIGRAEWRTGVAADYEPDEVCA